MTSRERLARLPSGSRGPAAENLAWGQATPEQVVAEWQASDEHCAAMMDRRWSATGVAFHDERGRRYWVQLFTASGAK
jgi:uncharacterized protein YkwD